MTARRFFDASTERRCKWAIRLQDGSEAQCGRKHTDGLLCTQHAKILKTMNFDCCGGNDELPPSHCADCITVIDQQSNPEVQRDVAMDEILGFDGETHDPALK